MAIWENTSNIYTNGVTLIIGTAVVIGTAIDVRNMLSSDKIAFTSSILPKEFAKLPACVSLPVASVLPAVFWPAIILGTVVGAITYSVKFVEKPEISVSTVGINYIDQPQISCTDCELVNHIL